MRIDIIQKGRVLRSIDHDGKTFVQAPKKGKYELRVHNPTWKRQMAVISVDGVNVVNGEDAGHNGPGYVLGPFETVDIPGFYRDNGSVAAFRFKEQGESYAAQTGRGTNNVGVIGMAVFEEKVVTKVPSPPIVIREEHHHHHGWPYYLGAPTYTVTSTTKGEAPPAASVYCMNASFGESSDSLGGEVNTGGVLRSASLNTKGAGTSRGGSATRRRVTKATAEVKDVGTAYGEEVAFHTTDTEFTRASDSPSMVMVLHYATYERLKSWGVPIDAAPAKQQTAPNPFPVSQAGVPAPPGWQG